MKLNFKEMTLDKLFFSQDQRSILKECRLANLEDNYQWYFKNVVIPITIILIPLFIQLIFPTENKDYRTLIFNGSISLIGINILFGMSTYLIKVNRQEKNAKKDADESNEDEKMNDKLNQDVFDLRSRLDDYKNVLVLIGATFYVIQALYGNYNSELLFYIFLASTVLVLIFSIAVGKKMFIIKDDFFEKTFYGELNEPVIKARNRWHNKF